MKCKLCGKKGVRLSHWRVAHPDYMARKRREAASRRRKAPTAPRARKGKRSGRKRSRRASAAETPVSDAPEAPAGFVIETVTYRRA